MGHCERTDSVPSLKLCRGERWVTDKLFFCNQGFMAFIGQSENKGLADSARTFSQHTHHSCGSQFLNSLRGRPLSFFVRVRSQRINASTKIETRDVGKC